MRVGLLLLLLCTADWMCRGEELQAEPEPFYPGCAAHCNSSCCYFSSPSKDCAACKEDVECREGAPCFESGFEEHKEEIEEHKKAKCKKWCHKTNNCCTFSHPVKDCEGCNTSEVGCHPKAECYPLGTKTVGREEL